MSDLAKKIIGIIQSKGNYESHKERLHNEIQHMDKLNILADLFSIYQKVESGQAHQGQSNDVNSLLAHFLGVTTAWPSAEFGIEKRRTYGRSGFPDIDMDFDHSRRSEIILYLQRKYGEEYVGNIGTLQTLKTKNAVRKAIQVLDPDNTIAFGDGSKPDRQANFQLQNQIVSRTLPKQIMKKADGSLVKSVKEAYDTYPEFKAEMDKYPEVYRVACGIEGSISAYGSHPAGIVISPIPLAQICPMHITRGSDTGESGSTTKTVATQFAMSEVEAMGLIKFDVLGLSTKTALSCAHDSIKEHHGIDIDLTRLPLDDKLTLDLLARGDTNGCFQAEKVGMQQTFKQIGIDSFDDLIVAIAMYRPGPKDYIPELADRKSGRHKVSYPHPLLKRITERTYGIMAYQEQVMQAFMILAELTSTDGYKFMKGCAKKKEDLILQFKEMFLTGAVDQGVPKKVALKIWDDMEKFGGYAFNKSHATSYAYECWKTAYLKAHFPLEFMASRLSVEAQRRDFELVRKYEDDAKKHGIAILPPDLNKSKLRYVKTNENEILRPLIIKDVGDKAAEDIISNQPFKGKDLMYAFAMKVGSAVNTKVVEALCDAKLFGKTPKSQLLREFESIKRDRQRAKGRQRGKRFS